MDSLRSFRLKPLCAPLGIYSAHAPDFFASIKKIRNSILEQHKIQDYSFSQSFAIVNPPKSLERLYRTTLNSIRKLHKERYSTDLVLSPSNQSACWAVVLDQHRPSANLWHNHLRTATYNAVYYLQVISKDKLLVKWPQNLTNPERGRVFEISLKTGMLLIMPNWLYHKPKSIERKRRSPRIAINMEVLADAKTWSQDVLFPDRQQILRHLS